MVSKRMIGLCLMLTVIGCGSGGNGSDPIDTMPPVAAFSISPTGGTMPLSVAFDASAATDADGSIVQYDWQFGDGETGTGDSATHTYTSAGEYTAVLTVTDDDGLTDAATRQIVVAAKTYRISGTVTSAAHVVTDSDVNDANATPIANDSFDDAQGVSAPVTVSGYVNVAGAGQPGNSQTDGDPDDYYRIILSQGATITLVMTEAPEGADLNLYLYDESRNEIDASLTPGDNTDRLTVPADGVYYVRVEAVADASIQTATVYALNMGQTGFSSAPAGKALRLSDDFVPGEVLVRFEDPAGEAARTGLTGALKTVSALGFRAVAGPAGRERLLRCDTALSRDAILEQLGIKAAFHRSIAPGTLDAAKRAKMETLWMVRALENQAGIALAEPNYIREALLVPDDSYYGYQWHYPLINLPGAWDITTGIADVVVAVVDTGVLLEHPDLAGQLVDGFDFISDTGRSLDGDGVDADPDDPGDQSGVGGTSSFHGTHVAGTIAAATDNGTGAAGIAWNTRIMPLRVLGFGGGTNHDIIQAVKYAAGLDTDYDGVALDQPVDIINLSLGGTAYSAIEESVYQQARDQGVIIIAAAGNSGTTGKMYPAAYAGVISVSAVTIDGTLASYSNRGDTIDVAAPGGSYTDRNGDGHTDGVLSTIGDDSYGTITMEYAFSVGTSMAAPHVAGVAALMKAVYPALTPDEFDALLEGGYLTQDLGASGWDGQFGWGLIDAYQAVRIAQEGGINGTLPALLSVSPSQVSFGNTLASATVTAQNSGNTTEDLTITDVSTDSAWLSVAPLEVSAQGLGTYTVSVDRQGLSDGIYTGNVTFIADSNQASVRVSMQVGAAAAASDGGYHYILLVDPDTYETRQQIGSAGEDGIYTYTLTDLVEGERFIIYAGTDPDNDGFICDAGEACGAYLSLDQPAAITVESDVADIDFATDINLSLSTTTQSALRRLPLQRKALKEVHQ